LKLRIIIMKDDEKLIDFSLPQEELRDIMTRLLGDVDQTLNEVREFTEVHKALSNAKRLLMMLEMLRRKRMRFQDFVSSLSMNPRIVSFNLKLMTRCGLVDKRNGAYQLSPKGERLLLTSLLIMEGLMRRERGRGWRRVPIE